MNSLSFFLFSTLRGTNSWNVIKRQYCSKKHKIVSEHLSALAELHSENKFQSLLTKQINPVVHTMESNDQLNWAQPSAKIPNPLDPIVIQQLADHYALNDVQIEEQLGGLSVFNYLILSNGRKWVLKSYGSIDLAKIQKIETIASFLHSKSFPVSLPEPNTENCLHTMIGKETFSLYPYLEGCVLRGEDLVPQTLYHTGQLLAELHRLEPPSSLQKENRFEKLQFEPIENQAQSLIEVINKHPLGPTVDPLVLRLIDVKLKLAMRLLKTADFKRHLNCQHFVHGDFHNENILFNHQNNRIVGLLDFEQIHLGHRMEDVLHFIQLACCHSGYSQSNLRRALQFLNSYGTVYPFSKEELIFGAHYSLYETASSFFLENELYKQQDLLFLNFINRDIKKLEYFEHHFEQFIHYLSESLN